MRLHWPNAATTTWTPPSGMSRGSWSPEWNAALEHVAALESRLVRLDAEFEARPQVDREALLRLAHDLPRVWNAVETEARAKQRIVRLLIEEAVIDLDDTAHEA